MGSDGPADGEMHPLLVRARHNPTKIMIWENVRVDMGGSLKMSPLPLPIEDEGHTVGARSSIPAGP